MSEIQKMTGFSKNIVEENIDLLKKLFPEIVSEGKIDFEALRILLGEGIDESAEKYEFLWTGKKKAILRAQQLSTGTLRPSREESKDWDQTKNLYIEGDNLEVLRLLQQAYHDQVNLIYIDPPYNTGHEFVYNDNFTETVKEYVEKSGQAMQSNPDISGKYHSNWLNMMYPRLRLAKNLLRDDGVIFISIDDYEEHNLRKLCDEIFGEENFIEKIPVHSNPRGRQSSKHIAVTHEFVVVYAKDFDTCRIKGLSLSENQLKEYNKEDEKGRYREIGLRLRGGRATAAESPSLHFPIYYSEQEDKIYLTKEKSDLVEIIPQFEDGTLGTWRWSKDKILKDMDYLSVRPVRGKNGEERYDVFQKDYLTEEKTMKVKSLWDEKEINYDRGANEIKELFKAKLFDYAKPLYLIEKILKMSTEKDALVLDFFSGSATTAHAVMKLNAEDGGKRRFIMVQLPEPCDEKSEAYKAGFKNICEIGKERIRRAGQKITDQKGETDIDTGFKVFKLDTSNLLEWDGKAEDIVNQVALFDNPIKEDRTMLDVVYETMLKYGIDLTTPIEQITINDNTIYKIEAEDLYMCLDGDISEVVVREISQYNPSRVVFRDAGFKDDNAKLNAVQTLKQSGVDEILSI